MEDKKELVVFTDTARQINEEHSACETAFSESLIHARRAGELLVEVKGKLEHGEWTGWVEANCIFSQRTAQTYMRIAEHWEELANTQRVALLSMRGAAALLASPADVADAMTLQSDDPIEVLIWSNVRFDWLKEHQPNWDEFSRKLDQADSLEEVIKLRKEAAYWMNEFAEVEIRSLRANAQTARICEDMVELCKSKSEEKEWRELGKEFEILADVLYRKSNPFHHSSAKRRIQELANCDVNLLNDWISQMKEQEMQITFNQACHFAQSIG